MRWRRRGHWNMRRHLALQYLHDSILFSSQRSLLLSSTNPLRSASDGEGSSKEPAARPSRLLTVCPLSAATFGRPATWRYQETEHEPVFESEALPNQNECKLL